MKRINIPNSIRSHRQNWLWEGIYRRMHQRNQSWSMVVCGKVGGGKSYLSAGVADLLDRSEDDVSRFSADRVFFDATTFSNWVSMKHPKGSFCVLDDSGLSLGSRESMTKSVKAIAKIFQSCRFLNLGIILNLPAFSMLDSQIRSLVNCYAEPIKIDYEREKCIAKFHRLNTSPRTGKIFHHRPTKTTWKHHALGYPLKEIKLLNSLAFDKPSDALVELYEARKREYLLEWNKKTAAYVAEAENPTPKVRENKFETFFPIINSNKKKYSALDKGYLQIDVGRVLLEHPDIGLYNANLITRTINKELKARRKKKI